MNNLFQLNKYLVVWLFVLAVLSVQAQPITPLFRTETQVSLNGTWKFKYIPSVLTGKDSLFYTNDFNCSHWPDIKVPGHWELQGFAEPTYKAVNEGTGLYRTNFNVPDSFRGNQVFIRFEGVQYAYVVYVNGKEVGQWSSSYNAACFNITDFVNFGEKNSLSVRVSTRAKEYQFDINDCWALSGIYREVVLFSTPNLYIDDFTVQTFLNDERSAKIKIDIKLQNTKNESIEDCTIKLELKSPDGKIIQDKLLNAGLKGNNTELVVDKPELWTAESPNLYSLDLSLINKGKEQQKISKKIGIREVAIDGTVLKLNGKAIKLRGVDYHDLAPETGRTLTRKQILDDLLLMQKANINFIRTSHYPPDRRRLDLCDSLGIYVVCEVPFGFGNSFLQDSSYQDILLQRAEATLLRDKNHPSVILWSLGNENPLTPITEVTGKFVKKSDPTRPVCYPQMGSYFDENKKNIPDFVDIYTPHYQSAGWVKNFARETNRPVIQTEYAHGLGLSFGNVSDVWREMFRNKQFAGGAVWHFQDQGILQTANKPVNTKELTTDVWIDSLHYYKTTLDGADGMVYADRTPQVDYWQLQKVYSPVQIIERELSLVSGKQELTFSVYNQYDFTNLNTLAGEWKLFCNQKIFQQGQIEVECAPHDTVRFSLPVELPEGQWNSVWLIKLSFKGANGNTVYEHTINLSLTNNFEPIKELIRKDIISKNWKITDNEIATTIEANDFVYRIGKNNPLIQLTSKKKSIPLINSAIHARTGRTPKMADITVRDKYAPETGDYFWDPWLLNPEQTKSFGKNANRNEYQIFTKEVFYRGKKFPDQKIEGNFEYSIKNTGVLKINYNLAPQNASGVFLEAGISFVLPPEISYVHWLGDGPYPSYPDKNQLNNFGFHRIQKNDINFNGNRSNVEIALFTDKDGNGIALMADKANISVELKNNQIVVSHNVVVSGLGNKKNIPTQTVWAKEVSEMKGEITIIPLLRNNYPETLKKIFGHPLVLPEPFTPFYYSYDTTK
ncbi:MAG TPA: hypothetical protein DIW50_17900 [Prolixibacteraceae bacterium]|nr:hypothetical protein [Prolixibacteraceae bacterium]